MKSIFVFFLCLVTTGAYPVIRTPPVLTGPDSVNSTHFAFNCEVIYPFSDPSLAFEVVWLFNGLEAKDVPPQTLVDPERTASLDGESLTGHMDTNLGCQVRSYYTDDPSDKSPFEKSTTYFIGIQVNPSRLRVDVDTESMNQTVTVISTIPIICDNSPRDCCLNFEVNIERVPDISIGIPSRSSICANDWNDRFKVASMEIPISVQRDSCPRFDGDRRLRLTFNEKEPTGQGGNLEVFKGITIPQITVLLKSKKGKYTCALTGDPHIRDFQGQGTFHLFKAGDFTAYTVPARDLRIQIRTRPCFPQNGRVTCICGVIIQERNDVIRLLGCDGAPVVYTAFKLSKDVLVERSADGWSYEVYLPSGTKVQVIGSPRPYMDVYITTSNIDLGQGRGLCGVNDQLADPGFTRLDGTVDPLCSPNTAYCIPEAFLESWRLSQSDSRFLTVDYRNGDKENLTSCENRNNIRVITCLNCVDVTRSLQTFYTEGQGWNDQPDTPYIPGEVAPFDPNIDWPNENGVTESEARELCLKAIQASQLFSKCEIVNQLQQSSMEDCMADILFGGSTEFLSAITSSVTIQCQIHVEQDPSSFLNSTDGDLVIRPELRVCPIGCKKHGQCDDSGVCICNNGWEGVACQIKSGKGPQMVRVRGGPICDLAFQNCSVIGFDVTNVNLLEDMYCQIQLLTEKNNTKQTVVVEATVFSPTRISCQLPETVISNQLYRISAMTNNNTGNGLEVRVFDSRCLTCTLTRCSPKRSVCNIDNVCYQNGEINQDDSTQVCDASQNRNAWTQTVPEMTSLPVLSGPNVDDNTFNFLCQLDYTQNNSNQAFEVVWTFDGKIDDSIPQIIVKDPETEATLDGRLLKDHFNTNVGCQVRSFYQTHSDFKSQPFNSNNIYAGIQVEPSSIRVVKKTTRVLIKIKSTLPILCNQENQECCLSFGMAISETEGLSLQNTSSARICREDWNTQDFSASVQVQVKVLRSACLSPSPDLDPRLTFTDLQATSGGGYMDIFSGYSLDDIMIDINDETFSCALYTDPHIITFDGKHYVVLQSGDYIGAEVPSRNFMVQTRVREGVNCGLIFRERNDVIRIDACFGSPMVEIARDLSENTRVLRSRDGRTFGISFPSGTDIKIGLMGQSNSVLNVFIILPGIDKNLSQGLCGTNDGNPDNDRNEVERWRVSTTSSLFNVVPFLNDSSSSRNNCSRDGTLSGTGLECRGCVDITQTLTPTYSDESGWYLHNQTVDAPEENPINVDQTWPNAQGVTQEEATDMCLAALQRSQLHEYCNSTFRMDETFLEDCLIDILYTGTSNYLDAITEVYTTKCLLEVAKEPDNFAENNDGELVLKPEFLEQLCLLGCDKNGRCENGTCVCQPGWEGETCHLEAGKGPQLNRIIGGPLCKTAQSECRNVTLDVSNIDLSNNLVCRIETLDDSEDVIQTRIVRARIISPSRISCDLPETVISTRLYSISMSNDRDLFGNVLQLRVYNSQCLRCTLKKCDVKSGVCEINGICYRNGERNGNDSSQVCDASQNRRDWSISLPVIETKPKLLGPKIFENSSFDFWCVMSFDHEDPNIAYEVRWTFNGQEDSRIPRQVFCYPQNMTTLDGADLTLQMNTFVGCRVRSYYLTNRDAKTEFVDSNNYYVGLQVFPREMSVVGLESKTNVRLVSTIPIICTRGDSCCLNFDLEYNETNGLSLEIPQQARLCSRDWDPQLNLASTEIPVTVKQDICSTSNKSPQVSVSFQQQSPSGRGQYIDIFSGKSAGEMKINVKDETFSCALYTDPHVLTLDGKHYVVLQSGDYIGAEVPSRIFEVQTRVREGVNCGLIFRERNDVIRIDACFGFPMVEIARNLSENTRVLRSRDGRTFGISFPSGTEIMIGLMGQSNSVLNVFIILPGFDKNLTQGLCGNNDGNPGNDKNEAGRWRVSAGASLFNEVPFVNGSDCEISRRVPSTGLLCPGCVDITQTLTPTYSDESGWYLHNQTVDVPEENPINVNQTWPNAQGVTQEEATDMCLRAIQRSQLHEYCNSTFRMDETFLEDCLIDILYTGSSNYLDAITEVYTTNCLLEVAKEPDNFAENNDGELILKPEFLEQVCLLGCDKNGRCENGTCVCQPGWEGETCHLEAGKGPQLNRIIGGPLCNTAQNECRNVTLDVSNIDLSNNLVCRIETLDDSEDVIQTRIVRARIISPSRISCDLPETVISTRLYNISMSNDRDLFGNVLQLRVYNSQCLRCTLKKCDVKSGVCEINGICYRNGERNGNDSSQVCDASQNRRDWSISLPVIETKPKLLGPKIFENSSFDFWCVMSFDHEDPNIAYEVRWTFNGQEDSRIPRQVFCYPQNMTTLDGADLTLQMNTFVGCRVRSYYLTNRDAKTEFVDSNNYYVGLQVFPREMSVVGLESKTNVRLVSTIPIICTRGDSCCLNFDLEFNETNGLSLEIPQQARLCSRDWDPQLNLASTEIPVTVKQDICSTSNKSPQVSVSFQQQSPSGRGQYIDIFSGKSAGEMKINVKDETFSCALYTDPHVLTLDGKHYVVLQSGDYIGAEVPSRIFEVQTRVREGVNCGLIFRERNDVIRIDACFGFPMVEIARNLSENTRVLRSRDGRTFGISFPSGTEIMIGLMGQSNSVLNVFIILPGFDKNLTQGLCGNNDGNPGNDKNEAGRWRVSAGASLFNEVPFVNGSDCDISRRVPSTGLLCPGCVDITQTLTPTYSDESGWYLHNQTVDVPEENPINVNQTWPNAQGVTQEEATDMCLRAIQRSQLHEYCNSTFRMDETFLEDCLIDILYTGTSNYLDAIAEVYTTNCLLEVAKEPDNFAENNDGELVLKPEFLEQVCLLGCDKNGRCENGTCVCQPGWEGETCHLEAGKGPQLNRIIGGPLCNTAQSECRNVTLDVSNIDLSNSLVCRIETLDDSEDVIQTRIVRARIISPSRISCDLPETVISTRRYSISMSNDRDLFGNVLQLRVYNSQCLRCTLKKCDVKSGVCEINGICYRNGERNGNDSSQVCDASQNRREWSISLPVIETKPKLLGPKIFENSSFDFWCVMSFDHEDPNIAYEVRWTFNGQEDSRIPRQVFCYPQNMTTLDGADLTLQMNTFVGCRVRSYYLTNRDAKTEFVDSNNYYVGLQVFPREMSVVGLESKTNVRLVSTIPIICTRGDSCCLNFDLEFNETNGLSLEIPQQARLCSRDWDPQLNLASTEIPVTVKQDICSTSNKSPQVSVSFQQQSPSGRGQYIDIFSGKSAGEMKINVKDETFSCALYTDPHVLTLDGKHYVVLQSGDYIGVEVPSRIFEVQTRVREGVNCGLIFRERNDVIRIDACFGFPMVEIARNLSENTRVLRSRDGRTFGISFPSGTEIMIGLMGQSNSVLNVFIILPGFDKNLTQGLCGNNDGNPGNDKNEAGRWRVSAGASLFNEVPFVNGSDCDISRRVPSTGLLCPGCVDITQTLTPTYSDESGWYLHNQTVDVPEENPINVNQTWPNAQGVTQEEATDMCLRAIQRSQLHEYCNSTFRMDETFLEDCLIDILYTGTSNYLDAIAEVYTTNCLLEVAKEPDNFAENNDGELVLKPEFLEQVCLLGCDKNGRCENGTCVCQPGWEGETCHLEAGKGPQLNRIIGGPLCNTAQSECRNVTLDVSNIDLSNSLVCRIETLDDSEDVIQTRIVRARIISPSRISCDLPETVISTRRYSISMSNDRDLFGNVLQLRVYNSQCLRCTLKKCDVKSGVCEINGICYRNGERNGNDSSQVCDASQNRRDWSISLPVIETKPKLLGPKIFENSSFDFWCVMSFDHEDPNIAYEVRWTFNGQEDSRIPRQVFCYPQNMTTLDGADLTLQMNTFVGCRVRSYYLTNRDAKTEFVDSNNYYVGLQVFPREMSVVGLESKTNVRLVSTIPIICTRGDSCCLNFDLEFNETNGLSLEIPQQARLCSRDWDPQLNLASTEIPVTVKQDICSTSNKSPQVSVSFQQQSPSGRGQYIDIFSGKSAGEMKINVKDETFSCALYTDPHVLTFDGKHYVVLRSGDYIGAEVPSRIFEVQTRVREGVNCGLIFRERNDVIRIDACFGFPMVEIARNLSENTRVLRSRDGRTFGISFPSGTEIMIGLMGRSNSVLNVFIILPGFDKNLSQGLCGNNDGNPGNDKNEAGRWRVSAGASLFNEVPFVNGSDCNISRRVPSTGLLCPGCVDITQTLTPTYSDETGWYLHNQTVDVPEENPINVNQTWPNAQGVTQEEATDMCLAAIQRSQLHEYCNSTFRMDETFLEDCLIDILYTGSKNYLDAITQVYTTNCLLEIAKEPDNFAENNDGELVLKPEFLEQLCLRGCDKNGRCENGTCVCQPGWEGETCHLEAGKGPQLNRIIGGPFCDVSREECRNVSLFVSNIDLSNKLACRIRPVKGTDDVVSRVRIVRATILSPYTISCDLPKLEISSRQYNISVSNDGQLFGNALQLQVFDSTCLSCDLTGCVTKTTACYINQVCYRNGAKNKNDESKICDIAQSLTQWTQTIPAMYSRPTLYGPNIEGKSKSFDFGCVMAYSRNDSNVAYEIMWMFEGQEDPDIPRQTISYPETKASLDGAKLKNHMNTNVGCRARAFYLSAPSFKSSFINSNVYYVGIQVRPKKLNVVGVYINQTVTLVSTVPVVCTGGGKCCMSLEMKTRENTDVSIQIPSDLKMCADDWNPELGLASVQFSLEITQPSCPVSRPPQRIEVEFEPLKQSNERYLNIFSGDVIRPLQIDASDEKFYCRMVTDPHIVRFDNRNYNMLLPGIFTAVEIPKEDFQIQIQTKGGAVCAVIIKEWNNVIRIDSCSGSPIVDVAFALSQQTIVQRSRRGTEFGVYLPSGAEVKVTKGRILNLFITLPAAYKNLAKGLCGTNDQNQNNEFTGPDGAQVNNPAEFGRSWRLEKEESLFSRVPFNTRDIKYNCTTDRSVLRTGLACHRCPEISQTLIPSYSDSEGWLRYPNSGTTTFPTINTNRRWPNEQGITEARATKLCQDAIQKSQLYSYCRENGGLDFTFMDDCMTDILFSGTTDFLDDITSAYTSHCQQNLAKDPENYVKVNNEAILKPEFSDHICPIGCEEHGRCLPLGRCSCDDGWEGESCHVQSGVGPILDKLIGGETCDVTQEDCTSVQIDVSNIDLSPKMRCKIQVLDPQGKLNFDPVVIAARAVSPSRVICPLVARRGLPLRYNFSLSNDGRLYGNGLVLIVFNSTCTTCDSTGCTQKANLCHINQQCFINGELKRDDPTKVCNVSRSTSDWTPITDDTSSSELGTSVTDIPNPTEPSQGSSVVTISRPHRDFLMKCRFDPPDGIARDIKVTWFVDGSMKVTETLPNGRTESRVNVYNLPPRGKLKCKVEHHGQIYESPGLDLC